MTGDDALADGVRTLLDAAARLMPTRGLGVVRSDGATHVVLTYADAFGATAFQASAADVPEPVDRGVISRGSFDLRRQSLQSILAASSKRGSCISACRTTFVGSSQSATS